MLWGDPTGRAGRSFFFKSSQAQGGSPREGWEVIFLLIEPVPGGTFPGGLGHFIPPEPGPRGNPLGGKSS